MSSEIEIPKTMRAVVYRGVDQLSVESVPVPENGADEVLVRVAVCGVCPTDIKKIHYGTVPPPRIFGHETAGIIVRVGSRVHGWSVGDRVGLHHHVPCMDCHACRHRAFAQCRVYKKTGITAGFEPAGGGYAEFVRVMSFVLPGMVKIPRKNEMVEGALLEPVNTVLKGVRNLKLLAGDIVWVAGLGPIGLIFVKLLSLLKVRVVGTDLIESRLKMAKRMGAWRTVRGDEFGAKEASQITKGVGFDGAIVAVPVDRLVGEALEAVRGAGKVLLFAHTKAGEEVPVQLSRICLEEKGLVGSYSSDFTLQKEVSRLVFGRQIDVRTLVSHRFPLEKAGLAVELASRPTGETLKVVVDQAEKEGKKGGN